MAMARPSVSVVVPFAGSPRELEELLAGLRALARRPDDQLILADNRAHPADGMRDGVRLCPAPGIRTPAFARNAGAALATGEWLVFLDADTRPSPTLLERYFEPPPGLQTAVLAGRIVDAPGHGLLARRDLARGRMSQRVTLERAGSPYAQTANCAVLRSAFEAVGGFEPTARAGEDADLCFRLARAGWGLEERSQAEVRHFGREKLVTWLVQQAIHGSGAAWVDRRWPGEFPAPRARQLAGRVARGTKLAVSYLAWGEPAHAAFALLDLAGACAFDIGRLVPNRPLRRSLRS